MLVDLIHALCHNNLNIKSIILFVNKYGYTIFQVNVSAFIIMINMVRFT